jgi:hypothetical protein
VENPINMDIMTHARRAYLRRFGENADQPADYSGIETHGAKKYAVLRNINGVLAAWRIADESKLHFVTKCGRWVQEDFFLDTLLRAVFD